MRVKELIKQLKEIESRDGYVKLDIRNENDNIRHKITDIAVHGYSNYDKRAIMWVINYKPIK